MQLTLQSSPSKKLGLKSSSCLANHSQSCLVHSFPRVPWSAPLINASSVNLHLCLLPGSLAADQHLLNDAVEEPYLESDEQNIQQKGHKRQNLAKDMFSLAHRGCKKCEGSCQHVKTGKCHRKTQISPGFGKSDLVALSLWSDTAKRWGDRGGGGGALPAHEPVPTRPPTRLLLHDLSRSL